MHVVEQVEAMQLQMGLLDFKLSTTAGFVLDFPVLCSVVALVFLVWINHHFEKNAPNVLDIVGCLFFFPLRLGQLTICIYVTSH